MEVLWRTEQVSCSLSRCVHQCSFVGFDKKTFFTNYIDYQDLAGLQVLLTNTGVGRNTKALVQGWDSSSFLLYLFCWHSHFLSDTSSFTFIQLSLSHCPRARQYSSSFHPYFFAGTLTFLSEWGSSSFNSTHLPSSLSLSHESKRAQLSLLFTLSLSPLLTLPPFPSKWANSAFTNSSPSSLSLSVQIKRAWLSITLQLTLSLSVRELNSICIHFHFPQG